MKFIYTLSLLSILLIFGCDQGLDISSPVNENNSVEILPDIPDSIEVIPWPYPPGSEIVFIPINLPPDVKPQLEVSKVIDGNAGDIIEIDNEFQTNSGDTISIYVQLEIPRDAFDGIKEISMKLDNESGIISFYPEMVFNKYLRLFMIYTGVDLSGIDPNSVDFVFQDYDGSTEQMEYQDLKVNVEEGKLDLERAKIHHFSRYGWIR